jgi:tyrosine-protein phosphatase YwqE
MEKSDVMIDIHCHILPGIDDGPATIQESVEMCRMAEKDGIRIIVATPHYSSETSNSIHEGIAGLIKNLEAALKEENIKVIILPGADIKLFPELAERESTCLRNFRSNRPRTTGTPCRPCSLPGSRPSSPIPNGTAGF